MAKRKELEACLTCPLCCKLLKDATTITLCLHTFCWRCINEKLLDEKSGSCPVCNIDLGSFPLKKLRPDFNLQNIRANIRERPLLTMGLSHRQIPPPNRKKQKAEEIKKGKRMLVVSESSSGDDEGGNQAESKESSSATNNQEESSLAEIYLHSKPPQGFCTRLAVIENENAIRFKETYLEKDFCPVVSVNLAKLKEECNLDLSPWLKQFESLLSISASFSPNIVKIFYFNMVWDNLMDKEGNLIEERIATQVRGVKIVLSASFINFVLEISNPPSVPTLNYSNRQIFEILRPNEPIPEDQLASLSFPPVAMPPIYRAVWYIYSRNLMQKGGCFTHFTKKDYRLFAAIIDKVPVNVGHCIFQEMAKFKFASRKPSSIPFPTLVSVILFHCKIWYIGTSEVVTSEVVKKPPSFGKQQLNMMRISFEEGSGQSRAPSRSRASHARAQEAQSAPPPPQSSVPSDLDVRIKAIVDKAISKLTDKIEAEVGKLVFEVTKRNSDMLDAQKELKEKVENLNRHFEDQAANISSLLVSNVCLIDKVDKILKHLSSAGPSHDDSGFGTSSSTSAGPSFSLPKTEPISTSPSFTFTTPIITTSPVADSTPTTVVVPPFHPSTVKLDSPPSTPIG